MRRARPRSRRWCRAITPVASARPMAESACVPTWFSKREIVGCEASPSPAMGSRPSSSVWIGSVAKRSASFASGWPQASPKMRWASRSARVCPYLPRLARVDQTAREAVDEIILTLGRFQQHRPAIRTRVRLVKRGDEWSINEPWEEDTLWYCFRVYRKRLRGRERLLPKRCITAGAFVFLSKSVPS